MQRAVAEQLYVASLERMGSPARSRLLPAPPEIVPRTVMRSPTAVHRRPEVLGADTMGV